MKQARDSSLKHLDEGERQAILLSKQLGADLLLIDEKKGRLTAVERGLKIAGVLGILELAAIQGLLELPHAIEKLLQTNIKISQSLIDAILDRYVQQK